MGQEVLNLHNGEINAGTSTLNFDVSSVNPGVYFIRLLTMKDKRL